MKNFMKNFKSKLQVMPVTSKSSENLSSPTAKSNEQLNGTSNGGNSEDSSSNKKNKKPVAPPRSQKSDAVKNNISGMKGSKSSFNLDPRPSSGRPTSGRPSSSRPGRYVFMEAKLTMP